MQPRPLLHHVLPNLFSILLLFGSSASCKGRKLQADSNLTYLLAPRALTYDEENPGRICRQYAEAIEDALDDNDLNKAQLFAEEARSIFWRPVAKRAGLPRCLDRPTKKPNGQWGPDYYSSTLGGAHMMYTFLQLYRKDSSRNAAYLPIVRRFADSMIRWGRDRYGPVKSNMFACTLVIPGCKVVISKVDKVCPQTKAFVPDVQFAEGQRGPTNFPRIYGDLNDGGAHRTCWKGENLMHSQHLYYLLYELAEMTGQKRYAVEADKGIAAYATLARSVQSGLYAWGEHASYDFYSDSYFDPVKSSSDYNLMSFRFHELTSFNFDFFLPKMYKGAPGEVKAYALAIFDGHILNLDTPFYTVYDRHGALWTTPRPTTVKTLYEMLEFPRHVDMWFDIWGNILKLNDSDDRFDKELTERWVKFIEGLKAARVRFNTSSIEIEGKFYPSGSGKDIVVRDDKTRIKDAASHWKPRTTGVLSFRLESIVQGWLTIYKGTSGTVLWKKGWKLGN